MTTKYFFFVDENSLQLLRAATESEVEWYNSNAKDLITYKGNIDRFEHVDKAFSHLRDFINNPPTNISEFNVNAKNLVSNFLYAFNEFLDHWQTFISRNYGKDSDYYAAYKHLTGLAFDAYDEYKITYALRNFQHTNSILHGFSYNLDGKASLQSSREVLLQNDGFSKLQREAIARQASTIDLFPIFQVAKKQLESIEKKLIFYTVTKKQEQSAVTALEFRENMICNKQGSLLLGRIVDKDGQDVSAFTCSDDFSKFTLVYDPEIPWGVCSLLKLFAGTDYKKI